MTLDVLFDAGHCLLVIIIHYPALMRGGATTSASNRFVSFRLLSCELARHISASDPVGRFR